MLISCRDERRYFVDFQSAEDCLLFRTVCYDLSVEALDTNRCGPRSSIPAVCGSLHLPAVVQWIYCAPEHELQWCQVQA